VARADLGVALVDLGVALFKSTGVGFGALVAPIVGGYISFGDVNKRVKRIGAGIASSSGLSVVACCVARGMEALRKALRKTLRKTTGKVGLRGDLVLDRTSPVVLTSGKSSCGDDSDAAPASTGCGAAVRVARDASCLCAG